MGSHGMPAVSPMSGCPTFDTDKKEKKTKNRNEPNLKETDSRETCMQHTEKNTKQNTLQFQTITTNNLLEDLLYQFALKHPLLLVDQGGLVDPKH